MTPLSIPVAPRRSYDFQAVIPAVALPIWLTILGPWWIVYEFHLNEGINFIKGGLVANGYPLYDQIWNDQPPGLSLMLAYRARSSSHSPACCFGHCSALFAGQAELSPLGRRSRCLACRPSSCCS